MNAKQTRFVEEYLIDLNATQSAIRAGYSKKTSYSIGQENLKKPEIKEAIEKAQAELSRKTEINVQWVIDRLVENHNKAIQAEAVLDSEGNPTGEYNYQGNVVNKALELLGRHFGMFVERHEIEAHVTTHDSRESVLDRISGVAARLGAGSRN